MEINSLSIEQYNLFFIALTCIATIASAFAIYKTSEISKSIIKFNKKILVNDREIKLAGEILEKLYIYNIWCKNDGLTSEINFYEGGEHSYNSRDEAFSKIPIDIKIIIVKLSSHSKVLEEKLLSFENNFIQPLEDSYVINEDKITEKIKSFREIKESMY